MEQLVFQLHAPLSSWGEPAVGEFRGTAEQPSQSALLGLLAAALGIDRQDDAPHAALRDGYGLAVGLLSGGSLLRDYHTAQVPPASKLKGRPHVTRRDELALPKHELGTILSSRDYRQNAASLVAVQARPTAPHTLTALAAALREPRYVLYLGRKACAPSAPLWPQLIEADSAHAAMRAYGERHEAIRLATALEGRPLIEPLPVLTRLYWGDHVESGAVAALSTRRKDRLIRRSGWQLADRDEHVAFLDAKVE